MNQGRQKHGHMHRQVVIVLVMCTMNSFLSVNCIRHCRRRTPSFIGCSTRGNAASRPSTPPHRQIAAANDVARRSGVAVQSRSSLRMSSNNDEAAEDDATNKINRTPFPSSSPWENPKSLVGSLLEKTTSRAMRTLSTNAGGSSDTEDSVSTSEDATPKPTIQNMLEATIVRSSSVLDGANIDDTPQKETKEKSTSATKKTPKTHQDKRTYLGNPSVTPTALAHSLWQSTILPYQDTVIDATCGNGKDCLALARMLFPNSINVDDSSEDAQIISSTPKPQLIGVDIQSRAIHNTQRSLLASLPSQIFYNHVSLLEQSHEELMDVPRDQSSVGLVCYNLGYLPGAPSLEQPDIPTNYKECQTQTETTLNSITDASLLLRVGGLLSIMTYPGSNLEESLVVEHFVEGLAMLTTRDPGGWRGYVNAIPDYDAGGSEGRVRMLVSQALERVVADGEKKQTWRAFVHKPLGRPLSPVLVTAMRIK